MQPASSLVPAAVCRESTDTHDIIVMYNTFTVEHSSFTPLVLAATGGLGNEATSFYKRLASKLSQKWDTPYSTTLCWLQCRLAFSLLRSSIQAFRGARSSIGHPARPPNSVVLLPLSRGCLTSTCKPMQTTALFFHLVLHSRLLSEKIYSMFVYTN